jgi:arylsulfatase A-like enzyme
MHSYGTLTGAADPWTHKYRKGPYEDTWHRDGAFFHEKGNATKLMAAEAVKRIEADTAGPWFGYVAFHAVHTPVDTPPEYKRLYDGVRWHDDPKKQDSRLRMAAMVAQLDAKVGALVQALERTGQRQRTLIIFTSDNGGIESVKNAYVGEVDDSPLNSENDPLRGQKAQLYEGGVRVCACANWPGTLAPRKHTAPMHAVDWLPTVAGLLGIASPADARWDGVDQWPALTGRDPTPVRDIYIARTRDSQALYHGDWKLIRHGKGRVELFDLAKDPYEKKDLATDEPARVAELTTLMERQKALDEPEIPADLRNAPH